MKTYGVEEGQRYGRLRVFKAGTSVKNSFLRSTCICDCGNITVVDNILLASGKTKSCGCFRAEAARNALSKYRRKLNWGAANGPSASFIEDEI